MKKIYLIVLIVTISCNNKVQEYYETGELKKEYLKKNNKINGKYLEYYKNGVLKKICFYKNGIPKDSSITYFNTKKNIIKSKKYFIENGDITFFSYFKNNHLESKGQINKNGLKIKNWSFFREDGTLYKKIEYFDIDNKEYINQFWNYDSVGKLKFTEGNYYEIKTSKDTVNLEEEVKLLFNLKRPFFSTKSNTFIVIPKKQKDLKENFSNFENIARDTTYSLNKEGRSSIYDQYNLSVIFSYKFLRTGNQRVKGCLVEEITKEMINDEKIASLLIRNNDTLDKLQTRIYFDKVIYVK